MKLEIRNVCKSYEKGNVKVLNKFNATFTSGVYGLLGPNGSGKSTLMNIITDNIKYDSGSIKYDNEDILKLGKEFRAIIGYVPQQQALYENFTAKRFLEYIASLKGINKNKTKERIEEVLGLVNLMEYGEKKIGTFSGGMKQRILIAQALLNDPKILLLDEPTAGLDPKERIRIRNFISEISTGKIVIISTHIVSDIECISKEILFLNKGLLITKQSTESILSKMQGKVFVSYIDESQLNNIDKNFNVSNVVKTTQGLEVRIVSDEKPKLLSVKEVNATLEDAYLYYFDNKK